LDDLITECFESHSHALVLGRCGVVVSVRLVVNWVSLKVAEELRQVLRNAVLLHPLVVLRAELGLGCFLCRRLVRRFFFFFTLCFDRLLFNNLRLKFFVFNL